jgi:hypothetical protein
MIEFLIFELESKSEAILIAPKSFVAKRPATISTNPLITPLRDEFSVFVSCFITLIILCQISVMMLSLTRIPIKKLN